MAIKLEGGGGKALMAWPLVEEFFFSASQRRINFSRYLVFSSLDIVFGSVRKRRQADRRSGGSSEQGRNN